MISTTCSLHSASKDRLSMNLSSAFLVTTCRPYTDGSYQARHHDPSGRNMHSHPFLPKDTSTGTGGDEDRTADPPKDDQLDKTPRDFNFQPGGAHTNIFQQTTTVGLDKCKDSNINRIV